MFFRHTRYALIWAVFILILCAVPGKDIPSFSWLELLSFDKWVHAFIFFVQVLLLIQGFSRQTNLHFFKRHAVLSAFLIAVAYGGSLEIMQGLLFSERKADLYDFIANSAGSLLGVLVRKRFITVGPSAVP